MDILPIRTRQDYKRTLREVSRLVDSDPDPRTPQLALEPGIPAESLIGA